MGGQGRPVVGQGRVSHGSGRAAHQSHDIKPIHPGGF